MEEKKAYATALLQLSAPKNVLFNAPLAFGEGGTKERITNILKNKKAIRAVTEAAVLVIILVALGFLGKTYDTTTLGSGELDEWITLPRDKEFSVSVLYSEGNEVRFVVFPEAYGEIFADYLNDLEVECNPITKSRAEDRPAEVEIRIGESGELCFDEEMTEVWYNNHVKASYSYKVVNSDELRAFLEAQLGSITEAIHAEPDEDTQTLTATEITGETIILEEAESVEITTPVITEETISGADGPILDYAGGNIVIFHDYYGLFVFDMSTEEIVGAVALEPIGCDATQGGAYCMVTVEADGSKVYLNPMTEVYTYVYDVAAATLTKEVRSNRPYQDTSLSLFEGTEIKSEVFGKDVTVLCSYEVVHDTKSGQWIYLESGSGLPIDLSIVVWDEKMKNSEYIKMFE